MSSRKSMPGDKAIMSHQKAVELVSVASGSTEIAINRRKVLLS